MQTSNLDEVKNSSQRNQNIKAAEHIRNNTLAIRNKWEVKVRELVANSNLQTSSSIINSLANFLEDLADTIEQGHFKRNSSQDSSMSKEHGKLRASFSGYFLPQLLKEFSLLREVINRSLQNENLLTHNVRSIIDKMIDESISDAATEFAQVQSNAIEDALAKTQASNQALEHFAAIAAHDLKSPLATIASYLEVLKDEYEDKKSTQHLDYIHLSLGAAGRMRNLIDSLLSFAKLSTKQKNLEPINLNIIADLAQKNLADTITKSAAVIDIAPLPVVMGDNDLLTELFQNLIANAIKFKNQDPPHIQINSKEHGDYYIIAIKDSGIGIDPKFKDDIFLLYKKLSGKYIGSGIGLATCKKILELHGGKIWLESTLGEGSTFFFSLKKVS